MRATVCSTRPRRSASIASQSSMKPVPPSSAATAAACEIEQAFEVLCDCSTCRASTSQRGPAA